MTDDAVLPEDDDRVIAGEALDGMRLDKALVALYPEHSRSRLQALIDDGAVLVDDKICRQSSFKIAAGQSVVVHVPPPVDAKPQPENIPLEIVYEDDFLLVINKQAGLVVHPGAGNHTGTLVNALLYHCGERLSGIGGVIRPGIVHRLDRDTSGLIVVAKTDVAHRGLSEQLADRSLSRHYLALVWGVPQVKGLVDRPIARHSTNRQKMTVPHRGGREARTRYERLEIFRQTVSLVGCDLDTGRTHQIRVHMAAIGHPLLGDPVYGLQANAQSSLLNKADYGDAVRAAVLSFPRQALHAAQLSFIHPVTGDEMTFDAPPPQDFAGLYDILQSEE